MGRIDRRALLLLVALEAARLRTNAHPVPALRAWLDSWNGLGAVVTGMERHGYDASLTRYPKAGVPRSFHGTTQRGLGWSGVALPRYALARGPGAGAGGAQESGVSAVEANA
jgi:hypothetical protein